jgi:rSAM/selenodomain-associated transferase 2
MKFNRTTKPYLTIIIPVFNEENSIEKTLLSAASNDQVEIVVVDGGSWDKSVEIAKKYGVKIKFSQPGRAKQLNVGSKEAQGKVILFLHADTQLPKGYLQCIQNAMLEKHNYVAGAFRLSFNSTQKSLKCIAAAANIRARFLQFPYGDQAIFLRTDLFRELGGFAELPIMEDFHLIQRVRRQGRICILDQQIITSARRWQQKGILKTTLINQLMLLGYLLGVSLDVLAEFYGAINKS